jgi:hypothetical protein
MSYLVDAVSRGLKVALLRALLVLGDVRRDLFLVCSLAHVVAGLGPFLLLWYGLAGPTSAC